MAIVPGGRGGLSSDERSFVGYACRLASGLGVPVLGVLVGGNEEDARELEGPGEVVFASSPEVEGGDQGSLVAALTGLAREKGCVAVLAPATRAGNEIAARLAGRLGAGFAASCRSLELDADGTLRAQRDVYAGRATATVAFRRGSPIVATLVPGFAHTGTRRAAGARITPTVRVLDLPPRRLPAIEVERTWQPGPWDMQISEAEVVVAGGRGICTREAFDLLAELAALLGGAVAASRPVVDAGLLPVSRQVGLSGQTVAPRLYVAVGISGSPHHLIGMRASESVIAINRDRHAPIFERADIRIVGVAEEILPVLIARIRAASGSPSDVQAAAARASLLSV